MTSSSAESLTRRLLSSKHEAMIEFADMTVRFITNRGVTHELVRHRMCSFAQESTRYIKYDGEMEFIKPVWFKDEPINDALEYTDKEYQEFEPQNIWKHTMGMLEETYKELLDHGWKAQQAREVLPNSLKTEIVVKANLREWRHIFKLRCASVAHPQMYELMRPLLTEVQELCPIIFDDITY